MKTSSLTLLFCCLTSILLIAGCNADKDKPQIADINSVGCLVANDFYAVHFSAYLQPTAATKTDTPEAREALLKPYCQELPGVGKAFFSADLIDRDVRKTPIGIRVVEVEQTDEKIAKAGTAKAIHTLLEVSAKLYPRGVVEAQATLDKIGDYELILIVGGEEALSDEDKLHVPFHVGKNLFALSTQMLFLLGIGLLVILGAIYFIFHQRKNR